MRSNMSTTATRLANLSFRNRCICADTRNGIEERDLIALRPRCTVDDCGNITHIDGRKVVGGDLVFKLAEA